MFVGTMLWEICNHSWLTMLLENAPLAYYYSYNFFVLCFGNSSTASVEFNLCTAILTRK